MEKSIKRLVQYAETAELDVYKVNIVFYFDFVGEGFGKAFESPYRDVVDIKY